MNHRVLLLASLLVLPLVLIIFLAQTPKTSNMKPTRPQENEVKTGSLSKAPPQLPRLATPAQEPESAPRTKRPTLEEAKERLRRELKRLETLTPEAWEKEQRERDERRRARMQKDLETKTNKEK